MREIIITAAVSATVILAAGCGSQSPASSGVPAAPAEGAVSASPSPTVNYQQQYLTDVGPYNAAISAVSQNATSVNDPTVQAVAAASLTFSRVLLQQSWPTNAEADVHALAIASAKQATDLGSDVLFNANGANDSATAAADAQAVRADLGLPAATTSP